MTPMCALWMHENVTCIRALSVYKNVTCICALSRGQKRYIHDNEHACVLWIYHSECTLHVGLPQTSDLPSCGSLMYIKVQRKFSIPCTEYCVYIHVDFVKLSKADLFRYTYTLTYAYRQRFCKTIYTCLQIHTACIHTCIHTYVHTCDNT